jgi:hypothetical protein
MGQKETPTAQSTSLTPMISSATDVQGIVSAGCPSSPCRALGQEAVATAVSTTKRELSMKIEFIVLLSALSLGCIACGGNNPEAETPATEPTPPAASEPPAPGDTSETPERGTIRNARLLRSSLGARLGFSPILVARSEGVEPAYACASPDFVSQALHIAGASVQGVGVEQQLVAPRCYGDDAGQRSAYREYASAGGVAESVFERNPEVFAQTIPLGSFRPSRPNHFAERAGPRKV